MGHGGLKFLRIDPVKSFYDVLWASFFVIWIAFVTCFAQQGISVCILEQQHGFAMFRWFHLKGSPLWIFFGCFNQLVFCIDGMIGGSNMTRIWCSLVDGKSAPATAPSHGVKSQAWMTAMMSFRSSAEVHTKFGRQGWRACLYGMKLFWLVVWIIIYFPCVGNNHPN